MRDQTVSSPLKKGVGITAEEQPAAVEVEGLNVSYRTPDGVVPAISEITFSLQKGERLAIVGESGSGKSTFATALVGLLPYGTAEVEFSRAEIAGREVDLTPHDSMLPVRHEGVSMIFQDAMTSLDPVATIGHQFRAVLEESGLKGRSRIRNEAAEWIDRVGIDRPERVLKLRPYELSGGMRQRVMIALALCSKPQLLVADEPTSALDASVSVSIMELLLDLTNELGTALMMITHDIELARKYTDKTLVLYKGRVQDLCRTEDLEASDRSEYTQALIACVPRLGDHDLPQLDTLATASISKVTKYE